MKRQLAACGIILGALVVYGCGDDANKAATGAGGDSGLAGAGDGGDSTRPSGGTHSAAGKSGAGTAGADGTSPSEGGAGGQTGGGAPSSAGGADGEGGTTAQGDGGESPNSGGAGGAATCDLGEVASAGTQQNLDLFGQIIYFAEGASLPAGRYRATYVDGCMKYGGGQDWTIHAYAGAEPFGWWLVGETTGTKIVVPPGIVGYSAANGAFAAFEDCVNANKALPPLEFDFAGGKLGVWLQDSPYTDNLAGQDGRNPKWQLTLLGECE